MVVLWFEVGNVGMLVVIKCTHQSEMQLGTRVPGVGGDILVGVRSTIHSDPWGAGRGVLGKVRSTIRVKKCHNPDQKVHLPIYEQQNKPMVLLNFSVLL